jgi:hypothetical protein
VPVPVSEVSFQHYFQFPFHLPLTDLKLGMLGISFGPPMWFRSKAELAIIIIIIFVIVTVIQ